MSHTPGPWSLLCGWRTVVVPATDADKKFGGHVDPDIEAADFAKIIHDEPGSDEFPQFARSRLSRSEARANAHLIAAAPDLLKAAKRAASMTAQCLEILEKDPAMPEEGTVLSDLLAAIAKAEGR